MITDDQIFASFKNIRGTPQYFHNMLLDVLAKIRQFGPYTFFLTGSAAEFNWTNIIKIVAKQYGESLTDMDINNMDWSTKRNYLKRNPFTAARQIDHVFRQLWGKVILSGMHPLGQILNYDYPREFQNRGIEHFHSPIHILNAPKIDEDDDKVVTDFIDKYITCALPDSEQNKDLHNLVKKVQTHHHTTTCRKKKGVKCRFNAPWSPSDRTLIIRSKETTTEEKKKGSKKVVDKVLATAITIHDLSSVTEKQLLQMSGVSRKDYGEKKISVLYKRRPCDMNIGPYNTVILSLLKANMNIQFVTGLCYAYLLKFLLM